VSTVRGLVARSAGPAVPGRAGTAVRPRTVSSFGSDGLPQ